MKLSVKCLALGVAATLVSLTSFTAYAGPTASITALQDQIKNAAQSPQYAKKDKINMAMVQSDAQKIADQAKTFGFEYAHGTMKMYGANAYTPQECTDQVTQLGTDVENYFEKATMGEYRSVFGVDGNTVMLVGSAAGKVTEAALTKGDYCNQSGSTDAAYWSAYIMRSTLAGLNIEFS